MQNDFIVLLFKLLMKINWGLLRIQIAEDYQKEINELN